MRYLITILLLIPGIIGYNQNETDRAIFRQVLYDYVLNDIHSINTELPSTTIIILRTPTHKIDLVSADYSRFLTYYKNLDHQTFDDFIENNHKELQFDSIEIRNLEIVVMEKDTFTNWNYLYEQFPNFHKGFLEFSNPGYNNNKTQAMIYYGYHYGIVGGGIYIIYEKKKKGWKSIKVIGAWTA